MVNGQVVLWGLIIIAGWVIVGQFTRRPRLTTWRMAESAVLGFALFFATNWMSTYTHFHLPFNPFTALSTGLLGPPGVAAVAAIKLIAL